MVVLAIDPGPAESAYALVSNGANYYRVHDFGKVPNETMLEKIITTKSADNCVCERIRSYGMPAGAELFETCEWSGRFQQCWISRFACRIKTSPEPWVWLPRKDVKLNLCGNPRAKDSNIRQAIIDRFGGKSSIGTKRQPGPLYGVSGDCWAAIAVGLTWLDMQAVKL